MNMILPLALPTHAGKSLQYGQLYGSSLALALANNLLPYQGASLILCTDTLAAQRLEQELAFFMGVEKQRIVVFPDWETLPYDAFSPHQDLISTRIATLYHLLQSTNYILIVPVSTIMHYISSREFIEKKHFHVETGATLNITQLRLTLENKGYRCVNKVYEHGEFAVRGAIVDIFPMGANTPYRIDLFDDEVDSIRLFDPETQLSQNKIATINLLPALEFPFDEQAISTFRLNWREHFGGNPLHCPIYLNASQGLLTGGIEYYLPLFFQQAGLLFDFLPKDSLIVRVGDVATAAEQFWKEVTQRYQQGNIDRTKPLLQPDKLFLHPDKLLQLVKNFKQLELFHTPIDDTKSTHQNITQIQEPPQVPVNHKLQNPLLSLQKYLENYEGRLLFCADSAGRRESLLNLLSTIAVHPRSIDNWAEFLANNERYTIAIATLEEGLALTDPAWVVITESQLFGAQVLQQRRRKTKRIDPALAIRNLTELSVGSPIVHLDHGVGRFSAAFALLADMSMLLIGSDLKRREMLSARLGDILSYLYLASAVIKQFDQQGRIYADYPLLVWSCSYILDKIQEQIDALLQNYPKRWAAWILRFLVFPLGKTKYYPDDDLHKELASIVQRPSASRSRLIEGAYLIDDGKHPIGKLETTLQLATNLEPLFHILQQAYKKKKIQARDLTKQMEEARALGYITQEELEKLQAFEKAVAEIIAVDDFSPEELLAKSRLN